MIFRPGILSHPDQELSPLEHKLSQQVVEFFIDQQDLFLLDIPPPPRNDSILVPSLQARLAGATGGGSPLVPDDEYFIVPSSGEEEGAGEEAQGSRGGWKLVETKARVSLFSNHSFLVFCSSLGGILSRLNLNLQANRNRPTPANTALTQNGNSSDVVLAPDAGGAGLSVKRSLTVPSRKSPRGGEDPSSSSGSGAGSGGLGPGKKLQRRPRGGRELSPVRAGTVSTGPAGAGAAVGATGVKRSGSVATRRTGGFPADLSI